MIKKRGKYKVNTLYCFCFSFFLKAIFKLLQTDVFKSKGDCFTSSDGSCPFPIGDLIKF